MQSIFSKLPELHGAPIAGREFFQYIDSVVAQYADGAKTAILPRRVIADYWKHCFPGNTLTALSATVRTGEIRGDVVFAGICNSKPVTVDAVQLMTKYMPKSTEDIANENFIKQLDSIVRADIGQLHIMTPSFENWTGTKLKDVTYMINSQLTDPFLRKFVPEYDPRTLGMSIIGHMEVTAPRYRDTAPSHASIAIYTVPRVAGIMQESVRITSLVQFREVYFNASAVLEESRKK